MRDTGLRNARLAAAIASAATASGIDVIRADVLGAAFAAAVLSSLRFWAEHGAGQSSPDAALRHAFAVIHDLPWGI